jgi:hypothetical protein
MKLKANEDRTVFTGRCDKCNHDVTTHKGVGDFTCACGAIYNAFGQRLRDDLHTRRNPSEDDEDIGDMEGMSMMEARDIARSDNR